MKVLHVIPSISPLNGGPSAALHSLTRALAARGLDVDVATTDDHGQNHIAAPLGKPLKWEEVRYFFFRRQIKFYTVSFALLIWFIRNAWRYDLIHIHALFSFTSVTVAMAARIMGRPYVLQPHGCLGTWGFSKSRPFLKNLSFRFVEHPLVRGSASLYVNSDLEMQEAHTIGIKRKIDCVPYAMTLPQIDRSAYSDRFRLQYPEFIDKKVILFLSRIHPKKGLDLLLDAFEVVRHKNPDAALAVVGDGEPAHVEALKLRTRNPLLKGSVHLLGFLSGEVKWAAICAAELFVLPSQSESFGIAVIEAMSAGTPVVVTRESAIAEFVETSDGGAVAQRNSQSLANTILGLLEEQPKLRLRGNRAQASAARYSSEAVALQTNDLYQRLTQ